MSRRHNKTNNKETKWVPSESVCPSLSSRETVMCLQGTLSNLNYGSNLFYF